MTSRPLLVAALTGVVILRYHGFAEAPPRRVSPPIMNSAPVPDRASPATASPSGSGLLDNYVREASRVYVVPAPLLRAVMHVESSGDAGAVSDKGAQGLMQLMPATAIRLGVADPFDPRENVFGGARYLRFLLNAFDGDAALALAAYNAGENAVVRHRGIPPYSETHHYLGRIAYHYQLELEARHDAP